MILSICIIVFLFLGYQLLPLSLAKDSTGKSKRDFQVYGCIATYADMVKHKDARGEAFDKVYIYIYNADFYGSVFWYYKVFDMPFEIELLELFRRIIMHIQITTFLSSMKK